MSELIERALPNAEDVEVIQRYSGQCLLGRNLTQTFLVLTGNAGTGKGTIANIIQKVVGLNNCTQLRTAQLNSRFEIGRYIGKTLLYGPDVPSDFLNKSGAACIKSLSGGDMMSAEIKGVQNGVLVTGALNIMVTGNERLLLRVNGDSDAWKRRLLWIIFEQPRVSAPVADFDDMLIREEGSGILNWMIEGARMVLSTRIPVPESMQQRVEELLRESNSVYGFISTCVQKAPGEAITQQDLYDSYRRWCSRNNWDEAGERRFQVQAGHVILSLFGVTKAHDIPGGWGTLVRGYRGIKVLQGV